MKKIFILIIAVILIIVSVLLIYWYKIIGYSAEAVIRKTLPDFIRIDKINLDPKNRSLTLEDLRIENPSGFSHRYLLEVGRISCSYRMNGKSILDGIEVVDPKLSNMVLNIERVPGGKVNILEIGPVVAAKSGGSKTSLKGVKGISLPGGRAPADMIKLPEEFKIQGSKIIFMDRLPQHKPHTLTFEKMNGKVLLRLNKYYNGVSWIESTGEGCLNGTESEIIHWVISLDPTARNLTMSNRFEVQDLDMLAFEPYYDRYSPFIFKNGNFSGTLIFDFNDGNIGSSNEIRLSGLRFMVKPGYENGLFMGATVQDFVKYFTSPYGEIIFDFKIKGSMKDPKFFLGPRSKEAIAAMAIDKVSSVIEKMSKTKDVSGTAEGAKSDIEKAQEYFNLFKSIVDKK